MAALVESFQLPMAPVGPAFHSELSAPVHFGISEVMTREILPATSVLRSVIVREVVPAMAPFRKAVPTEPSAVA